MKCKQCNTELYQESLETGYVDELGNELYEKVLVCPNGCDGFNYKNMKNIQVISKVKRL